MYMRLTWVIMKVILMYWVLNVDKFGVIDSSSNYSLADVLGCFGKIKQNFI